MYVHYIYMVFPTGKMGGVPPRAKNLLILPPNWKNPPSRLPPPNIYPPYQRLIPPTK